LVDLRVKVDRQNRFLFARLVAALLTGLSLVACHAAAFHATTIKPTFVLRHYWLFAKLVPMWTCDSPE
jgi:hypothetical protein